jgi:hypothetical protein
MQTQCGFQGYSGRGSRGGYAGPRGSEVADIWEVVSELATALQDARNQLVNLMHGACKDDQMRLAGGRSERSVSPSRDYSPRNVHRAHARGHVAFGLNSEYPVRLDRTRTPGRARPREVCAQMSARRRCTHPLHGVGAETRRLTPRRVQPRWPSGQVRGCSKPHHGDDLMSRRDMRAGANFTSASSSPDQRRQRPCLATQFASLLAHEAHQQRERRLAEEARADKRPSWCRY